ncbi:MAG TPA: MFS transporter, partial [Ktedonobacterales bacterium]|nr:MFS transporter [Ktedonobacterales bacterium]
MLWRVKRHPLAIYLTLEGALSLLMSLYGTVTTVYRVQAAGLNPLQLTLVGTALEGSIFVLQIPTGTLADVFSRRASVTLGVALTGAGFLLEGLIPRFGPILLAQVLWGAGYTFISGAEEAWISDEVGVERANRAFLRAQQAGLLAGLVGVAGSVALASVRLNLPLEVAGAVSLALAVGVAIVMPESSRQRVSHSEPHVERVARMRLAEVSATLHASWRLLRTRPTIRLILGALIFLGMGCEGFDRLGDAHFLLDTGLPPLGPFQPVVWFGVFSASIMLLGLAATEIARRRVDMNSHRSLAGALFPLTAAVAACIVVFGLAGGFALAVGAYLAVNVLRRVFGPLSIAWPNQSAEPQTRATVLSLHGHADAPGQIACVPIIGAIGSAVSLPAALVVSGLALTPALA